MKRQFGLIGLLYFSLFATPAQAGGDTVPGKISQFQQNYGNYLFQFKPTATAKPLFSGCSEITVHLTYQHVPWYAWMPLVKSSHPSKETTLKALEILREAHQSQALIHFGRMTHGLKATKKPCVYRSKGLGLFEYEGLKAIVSFYDPL